MQREIRFVFDLAALGLSLTPGPNGRIVLTRRAIYAVRHTVFTMFGGAAGSRR